MDRIRKKYNPEAGQLQAETILSGMTKGEFDSWKQHPCTKALLVTLESSLDGVVTTWVNGGFSANTAEALAMNQAKALGMTEALTGVADYIDEMLEISQSETVYEQIRNNTGR